ncbi:hypothetical protein DVH05_012945 [Phytophthora capsici]|nr:hypothetical protein DVH05_012945 [Phytophthora capsici]
MGTNALQLPALRQLHTVNQRLWTFVTCFMQSRRINTLFECHQAFLQHEGLRSFHELKIGNSFLHAEAVQQLYYSPMAIVTITTRDILSSLRQFEEMLGHDAFRTSSRIDLNEFLQYLAQQYRQPSAQAMGVAIDPNGFGVYVGMLRRVANNEMKEMKTLEQQFQREVAEKMFRLTKEKFSDENRKQALEELLENSKTRTERENSSLSRRETKDNSMKSLSLDMLKRVTDVDVYLDNVLRRKAAADAKNQQKLRKPISSQEIAETDSKLRTQMTRFLVASQKSRYHSRLKVVTWVICSIMAKTYALLLSDDKLPDEEAEGELEATKMAESDKEECDCCCVGKDSCTCSCNCKCHVESSDDEEEGEEEKKDEQPKTDKFPVMPTDPFAARFAKLNKQVEVPLEDVKTEVESFLECQKAGENQPQTPKDVLLLLSSLEKHLLAKFAAKSSGTVLWAGRQSVLELLPELLDDIDDSEDSGSKWFLNLLSSADGEAMKTSTMSEKRLQEEVLPFVRECRATIASSVSLSSLSSEKQQQWIAHRVAVELGSIESGLPSVEEMIQLADQGSKGGESSMVKYAGSLDLNYGVNSSEGATGELEQQAVEQLRKCPYLVDVSLFMDWQERYAPLCGSLLSFLRAHEMILRDHASSANLMFVCCLNGTIVRVNEKATASDLELLLTRAQQDKSRVSTSQVAVHLVSMIVACRSEGNLPKQLIQAHLRSYLSSFAKDKAAEGYPERLVLEILLETPVEFADVVVPLLLGLLTGSDEWEAAQRVWKACRSDTERKTLLLVSNRSSLWTNQTEKWCALRGHLTATIEDTTSSSTEGSTTGSTNANEVKTSDGFDASASEVPVFSMNPVDQEMEEISTTEDSSKSCHSFITDLRKKQFGVGLEIQDEATTSVLRIQQQRLERALKRLSDELYSESTHFVLELLQNADDNTYDDAVIPLGDFTLTKDKEIVFYNNEKGFSPANIQAICDVGASTKAVDSDVSIGKKGIGFKSVFKVSDDPQVHSNGFHICFHARNSTHGTGMGYILPYWLEDTTQWKQRRGTTFVLPLNETSVSRVRDISQSLLAFEPSVLLFLRRIRELRLRDSVRDQTLHFLKKEKKLQSAQLVQLFSQERKDGDDVEMTQQNWLVVKEKLTPPEFFTRSQPAEIAVAFPVTLQEANDRPPLQQVFCYLPLRSYGFRFILQGDFEIPSSREAITNGSEWNEWLVSKFPQVVRSAVSSYVSTVQKDQVAAISHLISLLPIENEVQAPFRTIIPEIMRELRQVKWLVDASGELCRPAELIDGGDAKEALEALGEEALGKRFLHPALSREMSASTKNQLRIEQLHASHLMRVLSLSAEKNDVDWTVKVLALLSKLWRKDRHSSLLRQELRLIKCFPLQQSSQSASKWISLADAHDSLFVSSVQDEDSSESYTFFGNIWILDEVFTKTMNKSSKLRSFLLNDVGIHVMEDHDLIQHHILPKMASEPERGAVLEYGRFLATHVVKCRQCTIQKDIKANLIVATTNNRLVSVESSNLFVILPSMCREVDDLISWTRTKPDNAFSIVATEYFSVDSKDEQWQKLLVDLCELPMLLDVVSLSSDERSQAGMKQLLQWIEAEEDVQVKRSISTCLAQYLDKHWRTPDDSNDLVDFWRDFCWLEGSDRQFHRPTDLWLPVEKVTRLFSPSMVTFSTIQWKSDVFSRLVLGLNGTVSVSDVLAAFSSLSVDSNAVEIDQIVRMYSFLWEESQTSDACCAEITKAFTHKALIVIKTGETYHFVDSKSAVWSSTAHNGELVALETLYPKSLAEFFTNVCGVQRKPSASFLCERIIEQSSSLTSGSFKTWEKKLLPLLSALSKKVKKGSLSKTETKEIKKTLKATPWLPVRSVSGSSSDFVFCTSKDHPVQATTEEEKKLEKLLLSLAKEASAKGGMTRKDIKLVQLEASRDDLDDLLRFAKVSTLSSHLEMYGTTWCKVLARLTKSPQLDKKKNRKKLLKLTQLVVKFWSTVHNEDIDFQTSLQQLEIFPTINGNLFSTSADLYVNDQVELPKEELQNGLQILGLFPWGYFVDLEDKDVTRIRRFLTGFCGIKLLSEALQFEVSVLSTQHPASEAFHLKIRTALTVAQRFLFSSYRNLYDQLDHVSIATFASEFQCVLVDGHDGFQVVYRVGTAFSFRRGIDASHCFLDVSKSTLYMQFVSGDEEATGLSSVLMEISRKLFGARVAPSVANLVYLSLLQSDAQRNQWLEETQRLPMLPEAEELWVQPSDDLTGDKTTGRKRVSEDMEEGEIETEEAPKKSYQLPRQYPPLPSPSAPYPPLPPQPVTGAPYQPPLPPSTQGMQSLALSNTMTKEEREAIGRWGEEYVFNQLTQQHTETESNMTVEWVNKEEESGLPYDLTLSVAGKVVEYIEVKSTRTMEKGVFEISMNELDQAAIHGSTYSIYRVFNAGNPALCRVIRMKNPVSLVRQRKIQLALVMQ